MKKSLKSILILLALLLIFTGGFAWGSWRTFKIMAEADDARLSFETTTLVSELSDLRQGNPQTAQSGLERDLALKALTLSNNKPLVPAPDQPGLNQALGWTKLYFAAFPPTDPAYAAELTSALAPVSAAECRDGTSSPALRRLIPGAQTASQPASTPGVLKQGGIP